MRLLYVEASEFAARSFINRAAVQSAIKWHIHHVADAYEAIDYLGGHSHFADRVRFPLPQVILLRLRESTRNGLDLLAWLRGEPQFHELPVVVASAAGAFDEEFSARQLAPNAWFATNRNCHDLLGLCEGLAFCLLTETADQLNLLCQQPPWAISLSEPKRAGYMPRITEPTRSCAV